MTGFKAYSFPSPVGPLTLFEELSDSGPAIVVCEFGRVEESRESPLLLEARAQLNDYFDGKRRDFDLPLMPHGSEYQRAVCREMSAIPYGQTRTYGDLDKSLRAQGFETSAQAVGTACGGNPIPILIPCHRVMGAGGTLTGFSGGEGVETKRQLLVLEGSLLI